MIARVLLPLPVDHGFDFRVPDELAAKIRVGQRVKVRFTGRERTGIVANIAGESEHSGELEPVLDVYPVPAFSLPALDFAQQVAHDYLAPPGIAVNRILPRRVSARPSVRKFRLAIGLNAALAALERMTRAPRQAAVLRMLLATGNPVTVSQLRATLGPVDRPLARLVELGLVEECTPDQARPQIHPFPPEYESRAAWVDKLPHSGTVLLYAHRRFGGYARLLQEQVPANGAALILAPEILLAHTLHQFLSRYVPGPIALYHSGLPEGERGRIWEEVRTGKTQIVVGTRSALFLPFPRLSLLVVDNEQDRSYKQDEMLPYYQARDIAEKRGTDGPVILGTAAPAVETFYRSTTGNVSLLRVADAPAVTVRIVDMKDESGILSAPLLDAISHTHAAGDKALIMVPRRGYFQTVICKKCGRPLRCPHCGVNLVYEASRAQLVCRVCGRAYPRFACPHCGSRALRFVGAGVERVEAEINQAFPRVRTVRVDGEVIRRDPNFNLEQALTTADIVVGTPMIAKGPSLPRVRLAAAIEVDGLLAVPDFRAAERAYQHLVGLADRMEEGELIVQTHYPEHYALQSAATGNYELLLENELAARETFSYPPFSQLARLLFTARTAAQRSADAARVERVLTEFAVEVLGPSPHPRRAATDLILIKAKDPGTLHAACQAARNAVNRLEIDINPDRI